MLYGFLVWVALTLVVIGIYTYRYIVSLKEDDILHLAETEAPLIIEQNALDARLSRLDRWARQLTMVDVGLGALLAAVFGFNALRGSGLL